MVRARKGDTLDMENQQHVVTPLDLDNESKKPMIPTCKVWIWCYHSFKTGKSHKAGFKVCFRGKLQKGKGKTQIQMIKHSGKHTTYCE